MLPQPNSLFLGGRSASSVASLRAAGAILKCRGENYGPLGFRSNYVLAGGEQ